MYKSPPRALVPHFAGRSSFCLYLEDEGVGFGVRKSVYMGSRGRKRGKNERKGRERCFCDGNFVCKLCFSFFLSLSFFTLGPALARK